jgi:hypothetical protein
MSSQHLPADVRPNLSFVLRSTLFFRSIRYGIRVKAARAPFVEIALARPPRRLALTLAGPDPKESGERRQA